MEGCNRKANAPDSLGSCQLHTLSAECPRREGESITVKFHAFPETDVYVNDNGHLVIRQTSEDDGEQYVYLPRSIANAIANQILKIEPELADFIATREIEPELAGSIPSRED